MGPARPDLLTNDQLIEIFESQMTDCSLQQKFVCQIQRASGQIERILDTELQKLAIGTGEARALFIISFQESCTVGELGRSMSHKPSTLSSILNRLDQRGLIIRQTYSRDRRSFEVTLSEKGKALAGGLQKIMLDLDKQIESNISERDLQGFRNVIEAIDQLPKAAEPLREKSKIDITESVKV